MTLSKRIFEFASIVRRGLKTLRLEFGAVRSLRTISEPNDIQTALGRVSWERKSNKSGCSYLARGRATIKSKHHPVIARLFGGTVASRDSPKRSRSLGRFAGVPDPILWKVLEFYRLGDWRRPCTLPDPDSED